MSKFVAYLRKLKAESNRKAMAELRRGLSHEPGAYFRGYKYTESKDARDQDDLSARGAAIRATLGGLFALHGDDGVKGKAASSLGGTIGHLYRDSDQSPSIEQRFLTLLDSDEAGLPHHLRQMIGLLKDYRISWEVLLKDLYAWNSADRYVQRNWARDFYRTHPNQTEQNQEESE